MRITTNGPMVVIEVVIPAGVFHLSFNTGTTWAAHLLRNALESRISENMEEIRREAYAEGWSDAKAKRKRKPSFEGWLP